MAYNKENNKKKKLKKLSFFVLLFYIRLSVFCCGALFSLVVLSCFIEDDANADAALLLQPFFYWKYIVSIHIAPSYSRSS